MESLTIHVVMGEINAHMKKSGYPNSSWYVGVTSDIDERLHGYHRVPKANHWFIYRRCTNANEARSLEAAYHKAGCKGSGGGGDNASYFIYAYLITQETVE
jgi:hypothetical protein